MGISRLVAGGAVGSGVFWKLYTHFFAIFAALRDNKENKIESWDLSEQGINPEIAKVLAEYVSVSAVLNRCTTELAAPIGNRRPSVICVPTRGSWGPGPASMTVTRHRSSGAPADRPAAAPPSSAGHRYRRRHHHPRPYASQALRPDRSR